jgi:hypothetical protein
MNGIKISSSICAKRLKSTQRLFLSARQRQDVLVADVANTAYSVFTHQRCDDLVLNVVGVFFLNLAGSHPEIILICFIYTVS